jgi:3-hydroxyisobutyrate dehydrogenase
MNGEDAPGMRGGSEEEAPASWTIGWIGLGDQGLPLVRRMAGHGADVVVWARRESSVEALRGTSVRQATTIPELAAQCDLIGICVTADADVIEVVVSSGLLDAMRPGATLAIHSTVRSDTCELVAEQARDRGVDVIDAPVTRNRASHEESEFTLLVGGDKDAVDAARPALGLYADHVMHLGGLGSGQRMKVINNALAAANLRLIYDALTVGAAIGLDEAAMIDTLRHTSGGSVMIDLVKFYRPHPRADYVHLLEKDISLFESVAESTGRASAPTLQSAARAMITELAAQLDPSSAR